MGYTTYSTTDRRMRSESLGYYTRSRDEIFSQSKLHRVHDSMNPNGVDVRECRDSEKHPNALPIILALDHTGSMGHIPHELVKDGLPTLMGGLTQHGVPDASLLFLGIGDHEVDEWPLQIGQFESGDEELDMWLTRTYLEGGGGSNAGESYLLAWYFAANHTVADHFEKRKQKGFLFTVGDEPCLTSLPKSALKEIMGDTAKGQSAFSDKQLLKEAQKNYNVFHLHILQGSAGRRSLNYWKELLGQNCIPVENYEDVAKIISKTVKSNLGIKSITETEPETETVIETGEEIL